jgi:predicted regulator of Ras-like GTPase activity (Roadblock/LC7/MglB family)
MAKPKTNEILESIKKEVTGFISISVVSIVDGMHIAGSTADPKGDISESSAYFTNVFNAYLKAVSAMNPSYEAEDLLITTTGFHILFRLIGATGYYLAIVVDLSTNLGMTRIVMKKNEDQLLEPL